MVGAAAITPPVAWPHYIAFLLIPIAIASPTLNWLWWPPYALVPILAIDDRILRASVFVLLGVVIVAANVMRVTRGPASPTRLREGHGLEAANRSSAT
jgi:hypothetical protein